MRITSASYNEFGLIIAVIDGITMIVPDAMENTERQLIAEWEAKGNTITPYVAPPLPPIALSADTLFFDRMTDEEYDDLDFSIKSNETARVYRGWLGVSEFVEGTDMWALLDKHLSLLSSPERKAELLSRP